MCPCPGTRRPRRSQSPRPRLLFSSPPLVLTRRTPLPDSPCSQIYCHGELLHQVQMAKLYQDDKQFVDMPLSLAPGENPRGPAFS